MKRALLKDSIKEIKNTYKRFISILLMAFLGVGFFAGLRASSPDMVDTIDNFYDKQNVYDVEVLSTLGLTNEDIEALKQIEGIEKVYGEYSKDVILSDENTELVVKLMSIDEVNKPILKDGKMPESINECLVEESFLEKMHKQIGDNIEIEEGLDENGENSNQNNDVKQESENEQDNMIKQDELKIVGTMQSPLYISRDKGTSKLGAGKIDYIIYCNKDNYSSDIYTEIYTTLEKTRDMTTSTNEYKSYVENVMDKIEGIKEERQTARYNSLIDEATEKVNSAEADFNKEKADAEQKIQDAEAEIQKAKDEINSNESTINQNEAKANSEFSQAENKIKQAKDELAKSEKDFETKKKEAEKGFTEAENLKKQTQEQLNTVNKNLEDVQKQYNQLLEALKNENLPEETKTKLEEQQSQLEQSIATMQTAKTELEAGVKNIDDEITKREK